MPALSFDALSAYLSRLFGRPVRLRSISEHAKSELGGTLKTFGYGTPVFLEYEMDGEERKAVLETVAPSPFGHDHFSDRAQIVLWEHEAFNILPLHVRSLDCGAFLRNGDIISTGQTEEYFLLTEFVAGEGYFRDLERIARMGMATPDDVERVRTLALYLADIHTRKHSSTSLYTRRIRELLGHGECIMGLIDNYPEHEFIDRNLLREIERSCIEWRWRIKERHHRLSQVHGDFHPWNILFRKDKDFTVLDRSRGEWGEPADDTTCLSINYLFSSLVHSGKLQGAFEQLWHVFWESYLDASRDREMPEVAAPFFAWRGLVIASPVWYPRLPSGVRETIFTFIRNVLAEDRFEYTRIGRYLR